MTWLNETTWELGEINPCMTKFLKVETLGWNTEGVHSWEKGQWEPHLEAEMHGREHTHM